MIDFLGVDKVQIEISQEAWLVQLTAENSQRKSEGHTSHGGEKYDLQGISALNQRGAGVDSWDYDW